MIHMLRLDSVYVFYKKKTCLHIHLLIYTAYVTRSRIFRSSCFVMVNYLIVCWFLMYLDCVLVVAPLFFVELVLIDDFAH